MTQDQALEAAAVMVAFANGRKIEVRNKRIPDAWNREDEPLWNFGYCEYRVAPDPWEGKIWVHENGEARSGDWWTSPHAPGPGWRLITAKEVAE